MSRPGRLLRGSLWVADLNPRQGTEPGKIRPVVVVQTNALNPHHTSTLICPLTTKIAGTENLLRVRLEKGEGGIARDSDIMVDQPRAMDNSRFRELIGRIPNVKMEELRDKLISILELE